MEFYKAHGLANDFLIVDAAAEIDYAKLAVAICARHTGVGADGLLALAPADSAEADFSLRFFNSDGSEAEMSGNGIRCAAASLYHSQRASHRQLRIATISGIKSIQLDAHNGAHYQFEVMMGCPAFAPREIPMLASEHLTRVMQFPLDLGSISVKITAVSIGNPHCAIFVDDFDQLDWRAIGAQIERHHIFPNRVNVEFVRVISRNEMEARFWERGAGETASSGTGSCGAAIAAMINGYIDRQARVNTVAGSLNIIWRDDDTIALTGPAEIICQGNYQGTVQER
jgi:diaminopimelate epimerase